jgi:quercetin dioxygenase-like cupin family protein
MADSVDVTDALRHLVPGIHDFAEIFRAPNGTLSLTVAHWPAGSVDDQTPHTEDEVYHVVAGRATLLVGDGRQAVVPGSVVYVAAGVVHRFVEVAEDLEVLVFWSPARHTNAAR